MQLVHVGGKIIAYTVACELCVYFKYTVVTSVHVLHVLSTSYMYSTTVVHATSCVLYCTLRFTQQTLDKAVVDLGKSESIAGLTCVCLSRAKRLVDLLIEPIPLERLSKIGDTSTFQLRLRKEVRLNALAGETLRLHGGVE